MALLKTFLLVLIAEMGDKTQLLAAALASKYKPRDAAIGIFIATLLLNLIAVLLGSSIGCFIPMNTVQIIAGVLFIFFGFISLREDNDEEEEEVKQSKWKLPAFIIVTFAFFIAELGDKTQIMTFTLAAQFNSPGQVLIGSVIGMFIADSIGFLFGTLMSQRLHEKHIKMIAGFVFIFFGLITLYSSLKSLENPLIFVSLVIVVGIAVYFIKFKKKNNRWIEF
ncbi:hypothetical protein ABG79_00809 [Caloramator mitchellensis]|uniref:GDT1 family protein n=1 Tax=Caloramator mitchellensis TaxID=908809 RepID=A0A0R3K520_CALMK|nr:TMEM165/GDT1 family protein [Caloramator mitchellensis]KRQ87471.1 hypothetical protein ABG79_00809 [Caloramator mitchellensis]